MGAGIVPALVLRPAVRSSRSAPPGYTKPLPSARPQDAAVLPRRVCRPRAARVKREPHGEETGTNGSGKLNLTDTSFKS